MTGTQLALEWSSTRLSVAWRQQGQTEEKVLEMKRFQAELALPMLKNILEDLFDIREIRIGRGPGNYSGIRQSLAWAFGYCAPGDILLRPCSSGRAQARRLLREIEGPFAILGDARRGIWWGCVFGGGRDDWRLQSPEAWARELAYIPVFSQETRRLAKADFPIQEDFPRATDLLNLSDDFEAEEPVPLYLHPPV